MLAFAVATGSGAARAALVTGHLDPEFGGTSALSDLYVTGTETFTLANACLGLTGFVAASQTCDGTPAAMNFTSAAINFYNEDPTDPGSVLLGTAVFTGDSSTLLNPILGMYVSDGQVVGLQSLVIGTAEVKLDGTTYLLDIQFGRTDLTYYKSNLGEYIGGVFTPFGDLGANDDTTLFVDPGGYNNSCNVSGLASTCPSSAPAVTTLQTFLGAGVPEPAAWATMLLGIGAIGSAMRRRRPAPAVA